jgi:hypothetical protein
MNHLHESALRINREDGVLILLISLLIVAALSYFSSKKGRSLI